jgi:hypothetical protein
VELHAEEREGMELCGNKRKVGGSYVETKECCRKLCGNKRKAIGSYVETKGRP